jgi:hypothetical protein
MTFPVTCGVCGGEGVGTIRALAAVCSQPGYRTA